MDYAWLQRGKVLFGQVPKHVDDVKRLKALGVGLIVSLLESDFDLELQWAKGQRIQYKRIPIGDYDAPSIATLGKIHGLMDEALSRGEVVYIHCFAGLGRAGTVVASYLVRSGMGAQQAIKQVRELRPGAVQSARQEQLVYSFENSLNS